MDEPPFKSWRRHCEAWCWQPSLLPTRTAWSLEAHGGRDARVIDALTAALDAAPRTVPVAPSRHDDFPERAGAAAEALEQLRVSITAARTEAVGQRRK